jgi:hypothetical protein
MAGVLAFAAMVLLIVVALAAFSHWDRGRSAGVHGGESSDQRGLDDAA